MNLSAVALLAVFLGGCTSTPLVEGYQPVAPGRYVETMQAGGFNRKYILHVPNGYSPDRPTPIVLMLHGYSGSADRVERTSGIKEAAEREGWISVFPQGVGDPPGWNAGFINLTGKNVNDVEFIGNLLDRISKKFNVDGKRIYVAGHSNGAMMANALASKLSDRIAAIAPVSGLVGITTSSMISKPKKPVSVLIIHGVRDPLVGYDKDSGGMLSGVPVYEGAQWWAKANGIGSSPTKRTAGDVTTYSWTAQDGETEVRLLSLTSGKHDWPSRSALGEEIGSLIVRFFKDHPKKP
jgi:polyhydroxybutyrate depolymerase